MTTEPDNLHRDGDASGDASIEASGHSPLPNEALDSSEAFDYGQLPIEEQVAALREELEESRREAHQYSDAVQRAQAELVNFRRRTDDERIELGKYSNARLITKLLPVVAELDLAVAQAPEDTSNQGGSEASWLTGVRLIQRKMGNLLQSEGLTEIATVGTAFNPVEHAALGTESTSEFPPGYVTQAIRPGYRLHDRVIQPAQVMVATESAQNEKSDTSDDSVAS